MAETQTRQERPGCEAATIAATIDRFQNGVERERSFRVLFDCYYSTVLRFFCRRVSAHDAADLTQETFLRLYKGLDGFRGDASFGTWLFRIAYHTWFRWSRRLPPEAAVKVEDGAEDPGSEPRLIPATDDEVLDRLIAEEHREQLREVVDVLPDQMRKCMRLRIYQELSYKEIAVVLGLSIDTVKAHLFQGRKRLQESLQDEDGRQA